MFQNLHLFPRNRTLLVDVLAIFFGISSWISINGLWVELPLLVEELPEGWSLPSYLSIIVQLANIGPIAYGLARGFCSKNVPQHLVIILLLLVGSVASLLLALFWDYTAVIGGSPRSLGLFVLIFFLSLVDCTSSILFMPYMSAFKGIYLYSYFIGEGLSGFVPSVAALMQGVSGNPVCQNITLENGTVVMEAVRGDPRFSTTTFFYFLLCMMLTSLCSFLLLHYLPATQAGKASTVALLSDLPPTASPRPPSSRRMSSSSSCSSSSLHAEEVDFPVMELPQNDPKKYNVKFLLALQCFICFMTNGALPSIQSYSCLPYGNTVYHLSVTLNAMASPLMAFLAMFVPCSSTRYISLLTLAGSGMAGYILATALYSPHMILDQSTGGALVVVTWVMFSALFSYVKVCIGRMCQEKDKLFWCGAVTQLGSAAGAGLMFLLVNQAQLFQGFYVSCSNS